MDEFSGGESSGESPILVSAEPAMPFTRAYIPTGMYDNFKVFTVSEKDGDRTIVMDGYEVKFITDSWTYVTAEQPLMFWDNNADSYLFTAGAPISAVDAISATSMTLKLRTNSTESAMASEPLKIERSSANFGKIVNLRFGYSHCRVSVAFIKNGATGVALTDITLTPDAPITTEAELMYNYDWSTAKPTVTTSVSPTATSTGSYSFEDVTIPDGSTDALLSATHYYCVPDALNPTGWTVSLRCDGELRSAPFVNSYTWESGKNYIYIFSLDQKVPKLVKVVTQEMTYFDCTDIIPGGSFSDEDMTE